MRIYEGDSTIISSTVALLSTASTLTEAFSTLKRVHAFACRSTSLRALKKEKWEIQLVSFLLRVQALPRAGSLAMLLGGEGPSLLKVGIIVIFFFLGHNTFFAKTY